MTLAAGQLDRRVTIQQRAAGVDAYGQPSTAWTTLATVWAWIKAPSGTSQAERLAADRQASLVTYSVRIRYRTDVTAGMRLLVGADTWDIDSVVIDHARREYVDLVCVVGAAMAVDQVEAARRGQRRSKQAQYHPVDARANVSIAGSLGDAVRALSEDVQAKVLRSAAYAGAELLARELEARVPVDDGVLKSAVYTYYDRKSSVDGKHFYIVGINKAKAPHWFNVEYGHWRVNVVFRGPNGDLVVTKQRLPQPAWTPAHPYLRPTADRLPAAVEAMRARLAERLREVASA